MKAIIFKSLSIRARVAFGISCLESAIKYYRLEHLSWSFILNLLWSYTNNNVGRWHEIMAECSSDSILEDLSYQEKGIRNISIEEYNNLRILYKQSNYYCNEIINLIFEIGTRDLYSSIVDGSPDTIEYLRKIINIMEEQNIPHPSFKLFEKFSIRENHGWGSEFARSDIFVN